MAACRGHVTNEDRLTWTNSSVALSTDARVTWWPRGSDRVAIPSFPVRNSEEDRPRGPFAEPRAVFRVLLQNIQALPITYFFYSRAMNFRPPDRLEHKRARGAPEESDGESDGPKRNRDRREPRHRRIQELSCNCVAAASASAGALLPRTIDAVVPF
jgi:hypothetical protein